MSLGLERLLGRMVVPNADLRCTAMDAMADDYWRYSTSVNTPSMLYIPLS